MIKRALRPLVSRKCRNTFRISICTDASSIDVGSSATSRLGHKTMALTSGSATRSLTENPGPPSAPSAAAVAAHGDRMTRMSEPSTHTRPAVLYRRSDEFSSESGPARQTDTKPARQRKPRDMGGGALARPDG